MPGKRPIHTFEGLKVLQLDENGPVAGGEELTLDELEVHVEGAEGSCDEPLEDELDRCYRARANDTEWLAANPRVHSKSEPKASKKRKIKSSVVEDASKDVLVPQTIKTYEQ